MLGETHHYQSLELSLRAQVLSPFEVLQSATAINAALLNRPGELGVRPLGRGYAWPRSIRRDGKLVLGLRLEVAGVVALVWLVGMTNAFNLLDNMDGLAATLAGIAAVFFAIDALTVHHNDAILALSLAVAGACAGFLPD